MHMLLRNIIEWLCFVFVYGYFCFCLFVCLFLLVCLFVCLFVVLDKNKITIWIRQEIRSTEGYCQMRLLSEYRQNFQTSIY